MANGETLQEIRDLLKSEEHLPAQIVSRLTLSAIADLTETIKNFQIAEDKRHVKIDDDLHILKKKNILLWVDENRPMAIFTGTLILVFILTAQDLLLPIVAKALGIAMP